MLNNQIKIPDRPLFIEDLGMLYANSESKRKERFAKYKCECGIVFKTMPKKVESGHTRSCGCYQKKKARAVKTTHNHSGHRLFIIWAGIISRTSNEKQKSFSHYGKRGIKVCSRWLDFENFVKDMFSSFEEGLTIDRIDNDGNYEPSNCRWATRTVQSRNTRRIHSTNTSGYRGVIFDKRRNKFFGMIVVNKKNVFLGYFSDALEAAKTYDKYIIDNNLEHTTNGLIL